MCTIQRNTMTEKQKKAAEAYERNKEKKKMLGEDYLTIEDKKERRRAYLRAYAKKWREAHPEYMKRYGREQKQRAAGNPKTKEYMRQYMRAWREKHPNYFKKYRKKRIDAAKQQRESESLIAKKERIRSNLPKGVRDAVEALKRIKNKKKEQRQEDNSHF